MIINNAILFFLPFPTVFRVEIRVESLRISRGYVEKKPNSETGILWAGVCLSTIQLVLIFVCFSSKLLKYIYNLVGYLVGNSSEFGRNW